MHFRQWFIINEMGITNKDQENLKIIIKKLIKNDTAWMKEKDILVGDKGAFWILNYGLNDKNEFNKLVRGLVIKKPEQNFSGDVFKLIKSFPFIRFFNQGEPQADKINFSNAEMLEKMDGTMVGVFFPTENPSDPHWHTRKMISSHKPDLELTIKGFGGEQHQLMKLIGDYVLKLNFDNQDTYHTYVFEFIHISSAVITKYKKEQYGLYLLAARDLRTHKEESESDLDEIALRIGCRRPGRWDSVADEQQIADMMRKTASEIEDFEGMVFRDRDTGHRIKLKDPKYVEKHHILSDLSYKRLVPQVLEGEEDEIIAYFPQAKEIIKEIKQKHNDYKEKIIQSIKQFKKYNNLSKKELWEKVNNAINDTFIKSMIMRYIEEKEENLNFIVDLELKKMAVKTFTKKTHEGIQTFKIASNNYLQNLGLKE